MIFVITSPDEEFGYICKSENESTFLFCLDEPENETIIRFDSPLEMGNTSYLVEQRLGREIGWDVKVVDSPISLDVTEDSLFLVRKSELNELVQ